MKILITVIMAVVSLCYLSDASTDPTWPFILFAYSVFNLFYQMYESSKDYDYDDDGFWHGVKTNVASFFGCDTNDYYKKRYETARKNNNWNGYGGYGNYGGYTDKTAEFEKKEYNEVVKFLNKTANFESHETH